MEFLGNKTSLLPILRDVFNTHVAPGALVADIFSGTASVSTALADLGYQVHANDQLPLAAMWAQAKLSTTASPSFLTAITHPEEYSFQNYSKIIDSLNNISPEVGWVTRNYTPVSALKSPHTRMYFTEENGRRIDSVRRQINEWKPNLGETEWALLMSSLIDAASRVSNIAGTYGSYLKDWKSRSLEPINLQPVPTQIRLNIHKITCGDAQIVAEETDAAAIYADPPYTKRQYAAYYHLLNSIVQEKDPVISGKTGLPRWQEWSSDWCYSRKAPRALDHIVGKSSAPKFILSYSSDGHIAHDDILSILGQYGQVEFLESERRRFKSSSKNHRSNTVMERVYVMSK